MPWPSRPVLAAVAAGRAAAAAAAAAAAVEGGGGGMWDCVSAGTAARGALARWVRD